MEYVKPDKSVFKTTEGAFRTGSLFYEYRHSEGKYEPIYTLKGYDHKGCMSLKLIYLSYDHIPGYEYDFANDWFFNWDHWERICNNALLNKEISTWKDELEVKIRAESIKAMIRNMKEDGSKGINTAKYLSEAGWRGSGRGRPSKDELQRELKVQAGIAKEFSSDLERIGLVAIAGGKK